MLRILKYKGCRRCGGDLFLDRDPDDISISCLQCGAVHVSRSILQARKSRPVTAVDTRPRAAVS